MKEETSQKVWAVSLALVGVVGFGLGACGGGSSSGSASSNAASDANNASTVATRSCDESTQPVCPSTPPSYASDITTIISTYCLECHDPNGIGAATTTGAGGEGGGMGNPNFAGNANTMRDPNFVFNQNPNNWDPSDAHDWSKYPNIHANATLMEQQVFLCNMPPSGAVGLTDADRQTLLNWLACGAPNN